MRPGRNDPCPCGSGKKYKHCCGARAAPPRLCGPCTACCDGWLRITIRGQAVSPGRPCPYSTGHSCTIYNERPRDPCREFVCGWLMPGSPYPEGLRPDRAGFIVLSGGLDWRGLAVDVIVPAGRDPGPEALAWLQRQGMARSRPLIYQQEGLWKAFGPPEFQHEIKARLDRGETLW